MTDFVFDYSDDQSDLDLSFCLSEPDDQPQSVNVNLCNGSPLNSNDFIVAHWNVNSILKEGRLDELLLNIQSLKAQVVINRPGVAGAVLHTASSLINSFSQ